MVTKCKRRKDKKQYHYNIEPELKVKLENEIKGKNKLISDLKLQFNCVRNKDITELKKF